MVKDLITDTMKKNLIITFITALLYGHEIELYTTRQTGKRDKRQ